MMTVYVTNNWDRLIESDFEFVTYNFPPGKTVEISEEAARHIFGYKEENKEYYMARLGIVNTVNDIPKGYEIMKKILLSTEKPKQNHSSSPVVDETPRPAKKVGLSKQDGDKIQVAG